MELLSVIEKINQYGATPALLVLIGLIAMLMRKLDQAAKDDKERHAAEQKARESLKTELIGVVKESEARMEERAEKHEAAVEEVNRRINIMERDLLPREEHYREFSGWRTEITRLADLIIQLFKEKKDRT